MNSEYAWITFANTKKDWSITKNYCVVFPAFLADTDAPRCSAELPGTVWAHGLVPVSENLGETQNRIGEKGTVPLKG